ncbi:MAG: DNA repair protein RadA [Acidimicrobiia bacterium]|nr:DNA repair protein RadA [Acidimicrobiia bacterium]
MYQCAECGFSSPRWMGFCPQCRNSAALIQIADQGGTNKSARRAAEAAVPIAAAAAEPSVATPTGMAELDRVLGGGLVPGAALLVGGEPGVGKSTLLSQAAAAVARRGGSALVVSAEESVSQVGMRLGRLGAVAVDVALVAEHRLEPILAAAHNARPAIMVVDSIQAVASASVAGVSGGPAQVRECADQLVRFAKETSTPVVLIGHVTKDGNIGGPKLLEHMVDVVLYLEGDARLGLRLLRNLKNRFGPTHEVGMFEMTDRGMQEVADPSAVLVGEWRGVMPGTVVYPAIEGRRPVLVEVQALVDPSPSAKPRRSVRGVEPARVHQLLAVLARHGGLNFSGHDVYVNVVGGLRMREPAADLPVALALASSITGVALGRLAAWGEVGLTGETRPAAQSQIRSDEAKRVGIRSVLAPTERDADDIATMLERAGLPLSQPGLVAAVV